MSPRPAIRIAAPAQVLAMKPGTHQIIAASAGTGKTYAIEHRVLDLVIRGEARIDEILVVTFTEKATAELRLRVRQKIESSLAARESTANHNEPAWVIDKTVRRRLEESLLAFDRAPIFTIHGFCHRVTAESGFASGRALRPTQISAEAAFAEAFAEIVRTELVTDAEISPLLEAWFGSGRRARELRDHLFQCRERGGVIEPVLDPQALDSALRAASDWLAGDGLNDLDLAARSLQAVTKRVDVAAPAISAALESSSPADRIACLQPVRSELRWLGAYPPKKPGPRTLPVFEQLDRVSLELDAALTSLVLPRLNALLDRNKRRAGQIDFGDMLSHVAEALSGSGGRALAADLRKRYPRALIDEFQDTSELQWRIFRDLYLASESDGDAATLTVVGDAKQAIYGFRGADLHTYREACAEIKAAGGEELVLDTNYRSSPALVGALNQITADAPGEPFFIETEANATVKAGTHLRLLADEREAAPLVVFEVAGEEKLASQELSARIAAEIGDEIAALLSTKGAPTLRIDDGSSRRAVGAADIMVLTRSRQDSETITEVLTARGIPSSTLHNQDLFTTREARELLDLLVAISNPRSLRARSRALATRFFDFSLTDLGAAAMTSEEIEAETMLHRWRRRAERESLELLLPQIVDETKLVLRELATKRGSRTLTNLEHLLEVLVTDVVRSRCGLAELAGRLEAKIALASESENAESTPVRAAAGDAAVQILTIHAAKGLEAPFVFLFGGYGQRSIAQQRAHTYHLADDSDGGHQSRRLHIGRPPPEVSERIERERDAENERLMYVAVTRAALRLYAVRIEPKAFAIKGPYSVLNRRLAAEVIPSKADVRPIGEKPPRLSIAADLPALAAAPQATPEPSRVPLIEPSLPEFVEGVREHRAEVIVTSYSRIKRSGGASNPESAEKLGNDEIGVDGSLGRLGGREVGIMIHWLLERVELEPTKAAEAAGDLDTIESCAFLVDRAMRAFAVEQRYRPNVLEMMFAGLKTPLSLGESQSSIGAFQDIEREAREVEFTFPAASESGQLRGFVTGFLDVVLQAQGKLYVVDWKSDALASYKPESLRAHVAAAYQTQLELYSLALEQMLGMTEGDEDDRFGGVIYCFLRGATCIGHRASESERDGYRSALLEETTTWQR